MMASNEIDLLILLKDDEGDLICVRPGMLRY